jgi:hypothetical protein
LRVYFKKVANHHGLKFKTREWKKAPDPGISYDNGTFFVTHLREPVTRSISHFKCKEIARLYC